MNFTYNLRFPGQYFDVETRLHYNYFRDYDPSTGRYIESDPIGIDSGLNSYGYAVQNPYDWIDPYGLYIIGEWESKPTLDVSGGPRRNPNSCSGRVIADCYFRGTDFGFGTEYYFYAEAKVSWSVKCKDTESCDQWVVKDLYYDTEDFTIKGPNAGLCAGVVTGTGIKAAPGLCILTNAVDIYTKYGGYVDDLLHEANEYMRTIENMSPEGLAQICKRNRK